MVPERALGNKHAIIALHPGGDRKTAKPLTEKTLVVARHMLYFLLQCNRATR